MKIFFYFNIINNIKRTENPLSNYSILNSSNSEIHTSIKCHITLIPKLKIFIGKK